MNEMPKINFKNLKHYELSVITKKDGRFQVICDLDDDEEHPIRFEFRKRHLSEAAAVAEAADFKNRFNALLNSFGYPTEDMGIA